VSKRRTKESIRAWRTGVGLAFLFVFASLGLYLGIPPATDIRYESNSAAVAASSTSTSAVPVPQGRQATHISTPPAVRGIYMTSCVAATPSLRNNLVKLLDETELDAVVIDAKTFDGYLSFRPQSEKLQAYTGGCFVKDMQDFVDLLHQHGVYVIARVASFQDQLQVKLRPDLAVKKATATSTVWSDYKGIHWIDASSREHWDYLATIAEEAHAIGFDEINFDYIRFPADGNMKDISFPISGARKKSDVMRDFYQFLHQRLSPEGITISADLFGMTSTNQDDLNIGQLLENALPNFDYIAPMTYPSHYPNGFMGFADPNQHVYDIVRYSMDHAVARAIATTTAVALPDARIGTSTPAVFAKPSFDKKKIRPWLQDNNYPVPYTPEMVRAQIQAAYDAGLDSWMLWNAGNRYTRAALQSATSTAATATAR
jgi:hypothetical protein